MKRFHDSKSSPSGPEFIPKIIPSLSKDEEQKNVMLNAVLS